MQSGVLGINEAMISATTYEIIITVGKKSVTFVLSVEVTGSFSFLNMIIMMGTVKSAPSSVAKNIPAFPFITKKSAKFMEAAPASMIEVVSPTRVAAP